MRKLRCLARSRAWGYGSVPYHGPALHLSCLPGTGSAPHRCPQSRSDSSLWGKQEPEAPWPGLSVPQFHLWNPILRQGSGLAGATLRGRVTHCHHTSLRSCHEHLAAWDTDPRAESQELPSWEGQGRGCGAHLEASHGCPDTNSCHFPHQPGSHSNHWLAVS